MTISDGMREMARIAEEAGNHSAAMVLREEADEMGMTMPKRLRDRAMASFRKTFYPPLEDKMIYAADSRCPCGAGLAYISGGAREWACSDILLDRAIPKGLWGSVSHCSPFPFAFYEIKSELQPSAGGRTTRKRLPPKEA